MFQRNIGLAAALAVLVLLAGCATSRSEIRVSSPAAGATAPASASGLVAVVRTVKDDRVFEESPKEANIPSLGSGGAAQASSDVKARAVGRKRNGFGMAMGDVLLESGQTVEGVVRDNLGVALQQAGYQVKSEAEAGPSALVVDVSIKKLWAWLQPGFWAIKLHADVATELKFKGEPSAVPVNAHIEENKAIVTDGSWMDIIGKAMDAYRAQIAGQAASFPKPTQLSGRQ
jgi:hypothetical protein